MDWKATLEEILAERRQELGDPPAIDDLIALRAGELSDAERSELLEHAAVDPEVARELFDVLRFPQSGDEELPGEERAPDEEPAAKAGVEERWQALRERLVEEGDLPSRPASPRRRAWLPLAAMFLLGVGASLIVGRLRDGGAPPPAAAPRVNLAIVELLPVGGDPSGLRGAPEIATLAADAGGLVLALAVPGLLPSPERAPFRLELRRGDGTVSTVEGLTPGAGGVFLLHLPREQLRVGRHELRLLDAGGAEVARFELEVELDR